ncbi:MAG TPA: prepilin-type N-terminal cleavage/methylation domain-containing protein [Verrucomicrobiae bacterium]|jgi:prepilin-type N-terminal cleavage/methylation domain-containing protein|nr:prepilin-type N-terminal cleavage/methylation domain-containing protein [Verrucomicrobiae bacterium]
MKRIEGFSLVEVMCAILILSFGLVGLTEGITVALGSSKEAEIQTGAALLAAGQIETVRAEGYLSAGETEGDGESGLSLYKWKQTIKETKVEGLFEISVVVEHARTGKEIYEVNTILFDPPITRETQPSSRDRDKNRRRR